MAKEKPILFNGDMVRAILDGRKTQTRRPVKIDMANAFDPPRGKEDVSAGYPLFEDGDGTWHKAVDCCPFGQVGDRLWVRETWAGWQPGSPVFKADGSDITCHKSDHLVSSWRPSIHMPRWASRITLEITGIRVERVQDISEDDAIAEGVVDPLFGTYGRNPNTLFRDAWNACYAARGLGWDVNPWVWVVEFKKVNQ